MNLWSVHIICHLQQQIHQLSEQVQLKGKEKTCLEITNYVLGQEYNWQKISEGMGHTTDVRHNEFMMDSANL